MKSWCERRGQAEIGVVEHEGRRFSAIGASVVGQHVTAYTRLNAGEIHLITWCGKTMLACRSETVEVWHDESLVLMFRLTQGRFIVGYALGTSGVLFRGELLTGCDDDDARNAARRIAEHCTELDADDEESWDEGLHDES
jgi:hypothetical protein